MTIKTQIHGLMLILPLFFALPVSAMKLQVSSTSGSYTLESEARRWKFVGQGRNLTFKEQVCGKPVWDDFKKRIESEMNNVKDRFPASLDIKTLPPEAQLTHFQWNGKSFRVPAFGDTGRFLSQLPEELTLIRVQETVFCKRMATK